MPFKSTSLPALCINQCDDLVQDCSNTKFNALELLQSYTKPSIDTFHCRAPQNANQKWAGKASDNTALTSSTHSHMGQALRKTRVINMPSKW